MKNVRIAGLMLCIAVALFEGQVPAQSQGAAGRAGSNKGEGGGGRDYGRSIVISQQGIAATSKLSRRFC